MMEEPKRKLKIDLDELVLAFDSSFGETYHYLDRETGEVILVTDDSRFQAEELLDQVGEDASLETALAALQDLDIEEWEKELVTQVISVEMDSESRYIPVPNQTSHQGYQDMETFIETVADDHLAELLAVAIQGRGAFRRFKDVLQRYPEEHERWFRFKDDLVHQRVLKWLDSEGIEPE
ncbi:MAG: hypothetical protein KBH93_02090 [Anaerolineae bacterium]|nr:hypothetical protein [Anaerolineae bacterium]